MEVVSPGANGHAPSSSSVTTINPDLVIRHLVDLLEITLEASTEDLESSGSLLSTSKKHDTVQRCTRFASESQVAIYVQKDVILTESIEGGSHGSSGK
jgi:dynein heavy chain 1